MARVVLNELGLVAMPLRAPYDREDIAPVPIDVHFTWVEMKETEFLFAHSIASTG